MPEAAESRKQGDASEEDSSRLGSVMWTPSWIGIFLADVFHDEVTRPEMLRIHALVLLGVLGLGVDEGPQHEIALRTGDVVFQTSRSAQSRAIQEATASLWSHVGIIEVTTKGTWVIEAVGPVKRTPWRTWTWCW